MRGIFLMLTADLIFAVMAAATKSLGVALPSAEVVFIRSVISFAGLWAFMSRKGLSFKTHEPGLLWTRGVVGYAALQSYFWALPQLKLGTAVMLNYTAPIFAVLFSMLLIRESPTAGAQLSLVLSFLGVWLLSSTDIHGHGLPLLAGLVSGILAGSVHVMLRQSRKSDHPLLVILYFTGICAVASGLLVLKTGWAAPTTIQWAVLLAITVTSLAGQVLLTYSLQAAPVWVVSPFGYLTPVLGLILGILFWGEVPTLLNLLGGALVILCGTLSLNHFRRLEKIGRL